MEARGKKKSELLKLQRQTWGPTKLVLKMFFCSFAVVRSHCDAPTLLIGSFSKSEQTDGLRAVGWCIATDSLQCANAHWVD